MELQMKLELSEEMKELGYVVIEPVVVRVKKKKPKKGELLFENTASVNNAGVCYLPESKKLYTMQASGVKIIENDLGKSLWCIEKRFLECKVTLGKDEEFIPLEKYADEIAAIKEEANKTKNSKIYTGNTPKLKY